MEKADGDKNGASGNGHRYVFRDFEIDPANRTCLRGGEVVPLTGRVFDILLVFAQNPGRLLKKDELIEKVWHGDFVEDGNLTRNVSSLRKALGDDSKDYKFIATVQGHGYRFIPDVSEISAVSEVPSVSTAIHFPMEEPRSPTSVIPASVAAEKPSLKWLWAIPIAAILFSAVWIAKQKRSLTPADQIKSLAVLPLKSLEPGDSYLGAGIADAVIVRLSQSGQLLVRPTSAVIHYVNENTDALAAGRQLNADTVMEGTLQRSGDRLRVSVNLLRTSDGTSLWADTFNVVMADIFVLQDRVAEQVALRLQLRLEPSQLAYDNRAELGVVTANARYPASPIAYEYYLKGVFNLDERGYGEGKLPQMETTIDFFKKAIDTDPAYGLAHAQLAFAYVWTALFIQPNAKWADLARMEIKRSQETGSRLAETHQASALLLWSSYEGFQNEAAVRELVVAQQLNPNIGRGDLAAIYAHMGLDDLAAEELRRALEIDPASKSFNELTLILPYLAVKPDEYLTAWEKVSGGLAKVGHMAPPWYYLRKGQLDDAQKAIDEWSVHSPNDPDLLMQQALLLALKGDFEKPELSVPGILAKYQLNDQRRHHGTYDAACIYALAGKSSEAVKWLKETAASGSPNYPLFGRDHYLDRIRLTPEFVQFLADQKAHWEAYRQEFGG